MPLAVGTEESDGTLSHAMNKQEYIERLQLLIRQLHGCDSAHRRTWLIHENFPGRGEWIGDVEEFEVEHRNTNRCYAWSQKEGALGLDGLFVAVLAIPPVKSAASAVLASLNADIKKGKL